GSSRMLAASRSMRSPVCSWFPWPKHKTALGRCRETNSITRSADAERITGRTAVSTVSPAMSCRASAWAISMLGLTYRPPNDSNPCTGMDPAMLPEGSACPRAHPATPIATNLGNAIKFKETGEIRIETAATDGSFLVSVSDTGSAIPQADTIFEEFQQADS